MTVRILKPENSSCGVRKPATEKSSMIISEATAGGKKKNTTLFQKYRKSNNSPCRYMLLLSSSLRTTIVHRAKKIPLIVIVPTTTAVLFLLLYSLVIANSHRSTENNNRMITLTSTAFTQGGSIPKLYTRKDGEDKSPPLEWNNVPPGTKSLALIVDDPDAPNPAAPKMTWVHWVLYNIPTTTSGLDEGMTVSTLPEGTKQALNSWKTMGYGGPSPPIGRHRYFFKLYALDVILDDLGSTANKETLVQAMDSHILGKAELMGTYQKK